jgi:3-oxoacyl-[acyl-carrier-protein] synthase-1
MTSFPSYKSNSEVFVYGLGAVTSIGLTAWATAAAQRAGVSGFGEHPFMVDSRGEPIIVSQCPLVSSQPRIENRINDCLIAAIRESLIPLKDIAPDAAITLMVNLPSPRPGLPELLQENVHTSLEQAFPGIFKRITVSQQGHAGSLLGLQSVIQSLSGIAKEAYVIAGSDSYLDPETLEWLEETDQLHAAGPRNNAWGFVPGEGAGALLLAPENIARKGEIKPLARIRSTGVGKEVNTIRTDSVCLGKGLTEAYRAAFAGLGENDRISDVYCDMNGEVYRGDEFGFAVARTRERFVTVSDFIAPADCWGDVGAASAALLIVSACIAFSKCYAKGERGLVWASSETGERGAVVIEALGGNRNGDYQG